MTKTIYSHRAEPYFTFVKTGLKTIEGRIRRGKYRDIAHGDHITIFTNDETQHIEVVVTGIRNYPSFEEMLKKEDLGKVLPNALSVSDGVNIYRQFYSAEEEKECGVVAIEINRCE